MTPLTRSGLQMLQDFIAGKVAHPMAETLNFRPIAASVGLVTWEARPDDRHLSSRGQVQGGYLAALLDSVTGSAIASHVEAGVDYVTVDLAVKMIRPVEAGTVLRAEGRALSVSRRIGTAEASVHDAAGRLIGTGTATMLLTRPS
jgi:uncharacterized protein (TIGR00369 family)